MDTFFMYAGLAIGAFLLVSGILAFIMRSQGKHQAGPVQIFTRYAASRFNGMISKICYFVFPFLVLFFWSAIGGWMVMAAMIMGLFFIKKPVVLDRPAGYVAPSQPVDVTPVDRTSTLRQQAMGGHIHQVKATGPIAGDPTDPRNIA